MVKVAVLDDWQGVAPEQRRTGRRSWRVPCLFSADLPGAAKITIISYS